VGRADAAWNRPVVHGDGPELHVRELHVPRTAPADPDRVDRDNVGLPSPHDEGQAAVRRQGLPQVSCGWYQWRCLLAGKSRATRELDERQASAWRSSKPQTQPDGALGISATL